MRRKECEKLVGRKCAIYWRKDSIYHPAVVSSYSRENGKHQVSKEAAFNT
jgi:hypothetical protein